MKQLRFERRKVVHYSLLGAIILLQIIAIVTWYNETKLSKAFDDMAFAGKINRLNNSLVLSQGQLNTYITSKDEASLDNYSKSIADINAIIDSIDLDKKDAATKSLLAKKQKIQAEIKLVKKAVDSIININLSQNELPKLFELKEFEVNKFLDNVKTDSYVKVDSISRKGFFSRLGDALANRVNVQKEYVNTVVTMQYKNKVKTGDVNDQLANVIRITNEYYVKEFTKLKNSFSSIRSNDTKLMQLNNELLSLSQSLASDFTAANPLLKPEKQKQLQDQYDTHKTVRSFAIVLLIVLMLVISVILFNYTRIAFEYEKRLVQAQEKISESLNFKNRITGMMSHEIRSPLSIISMYSKKAGASVKEPELRETFKSIEFTTNSLLLLSNHILEYSKDENHELKLKSKNINLKSEVYQIVNSMASLAEAKGNALEVTSNLQDDTVVYSDAGKIHQLFYNLIGNANKFTENGKIKVGMNLDNISDYEMNFKVVISDNGIGIAENDLKNIFESYYQGTVSEKVNDLGVGLGLNICKEIIELFDGEIAVESMPEKGTTFTFNLILAQV